MKLAKRHTKKIIIISAAVLIVVAINVVAHAASKQKIAEKKVDTTARATKPDTVEVPKAESKPTAVTPATTPTVTPAAPQVQSTESVAAPEMTEEEKSRELAMNNYCTQLHWKLYSIRNVPESERMLAIKQAGALFLYEKFYDECVELGKLQPM